MDLEQIYRINLEDAEGLYKVAKEKNDLELMQRATMDKQKWIDKLQKMTNECIADSPD